MLPPIPALDIQATLLAVLVLGFASVSSSGSGSDEESLHGFPLIKTARPLCTQRVYSLDSEISWDALTAPEPPEKVALFYKERLGTEALEQSEGEWTWRLPVGAPQPDHVLSLHPVTADGPWKQCEEPIPADARTIIMLSSMLRREPKP